MSPRNPTQMCRRYVSTSNTASGTHQARGSPNLLGYNKTSVVLGRKGLGWLAKGSHFLAWPCDGIPTRAQRVPSACIAPRTMKLDHAWAGVATRAAACERRRLARRPPVAKILKTHGQPHNNLTTHAWPTRLAGTHNSRTGPLTLCHSVPTRGAKREGRTSIQPRSRTPPVAGCSTPPNHVDSGE